MRGEGVFVKISVKSDVFMVCIRDERGEKHLTYPITDLMHNVGSFFRMEVVK